MPNPFAWYFALLTAMLIAAAGASTASGSPSAPSSSPSTSASSTAAAPTTTSASSTAAPSTATSTAAPSTATSTAAPSTSATSTQASTSSTTTGGTGDTGDTSCGGEAPTKADGTAWACSFDDEFDGTSLDTSKWTVQTTAASGFTAGPTCFENNPNNVAVSGGYLDLTVRKEAAPFTCASPTGNFNTQYTSGSVNGSGKFSQTYGRFEVRAKLPAATVKGLQETLWLWPNDPLKYGPWPGSGEIDFAEFYSQYPGWTIPYIHYNSTTATGNWTTNGNVFTALPAPYTQPGMSCSIDQSGFNTYAVVWAPGQITIQVNGTDCIVDNYSAVGLSGGAPFDQPFFMALTQGLGIGANAFDATHTPLPATTQVDYVRIWK